MRNPAPHPAPRTPHPATRTPPAAAAHANLLPCSPCLLLWVSGSVGKGRCGSLGNVCPSRQVLLRNEGGTLPLSKAKTTAAIGPLADAQGTLIGNYMGQICPDNGNVPCTRQTKHAVRIRLWENCCRQAPDKRDGAAARCAAIVWGVVRRSAAQGGAAQGGVGVLLLRGLVLGLCAGPVPELVC